MTLTDRQTKKTERYADAPLPPPLPPPRSFECLLFVIFALLFLSALLFFDLLQRIVFLTRRELQFTVIERLNRVIFLIMRIVGIRMTVSGWRAFNAEKPYLIVSNHQSLLDIPILMHLFHGRPVRFIAKKELAHGIPSVSFYLQHGGNCLIDRDNPEQAVNAIKEFGQRVEREKFVAVIFPEGTRARDGRLKRFRPKGLITLLEEAPTAEIIPVTLEGSWMVQARKFGPIPFGLEIHVTVAPPIRREHYRDSLKLVQELERVMTQNLSALRTKA